MDPITTLGAVHITITALRMLTQLTSVYTGVTDSPYQPPKKILSELPILISLLEDIQSKASNSYTQPSPTVSVALQICVERFEELIEYLTDMGLDPMTGQALPGKRHKLQRVVEMIHLVNNSGQLQDATKRFRSALTLLRDIAMDHRTHDLITQQRAFLSYQFDYTRTCLARQRPPPSDDFMEDICVDSSDGSLTDAEGRPSLRFSPGSGTLFSITFSLDVPDGDRPLFYPARGKYDTGCPDCLISESVIRKHNLESRLERMDTERQYAGLGNVVVVSKFQLHLNWSANNETVSRRNTFYLVADSPFELLLGEDFMKANSPLLPALPIRLLNRKSKAQKKLELEIEAENLRKGVELAEQRRRGKNKQNPVSEGQVRSTGVTPSEINHRHLRTTPESLTEKETTVHRTLDDNAPEPAEKTPALSSSILPSNEDITEQKIIVHNGHEPVQDIITGVITEAPFSPSVPGQLLSKDQQSVQDTSKVAEDISTDGPPPLGNGTTTGEAIPSPDSGYLSEVQDETPRSTKNIAKEQRESPTAERSTGSQLVPDVPEKSAVEIILNGTSRREGHLGIRKRRWVLWR